MLVLDLTFGCFPVVFSIFCFRTRRQADNHSLTVSAYAGRARHKWELRMQDSHVRDTRGSWEQRQDSGGSVFYHCTDPLQPDPFRYLADYLTHSQVYLFTYQTRVPARKNKALLLRMERSGKCSYGCFARAPSPLKQ